MFKCPAQRFCDSFFAWRVEFSGQLFLSTASILPTMTLKHLFTSKRNHIESSEPRSHKTVSLYSCEFLPNSLRSHCLLRDHMTSNIETRISMFSLAPSRETAWLSGNKINCFPRDRSLSVFLLCSLSFQDRGFSYSYSLAAGANVCSAFCYSLWLPRHCVMNRFSTLPLIPWRKLLHARTLPAMGQVQLCAAFHMWSAVAGTSQKLTWCNVPAKAVDKEDDGFPARNSWPRTIHPPPVMISPGFLQ